MEVANKHTLSPADIAITREKLFIPDAVFASDNDLDIPTLQMDMQPEYCDIPFVCFGEQKRTFDMDGKGTLHFYTDDYRFTAVYEHPEKILQHKPRNIVEPNFSTFNEMPVAFAIQNIYKKRYIARALQEKGVKVFVDLNVAGKYYQLNMLGVPFGWSSFCTRGYCDRLHYLAAEYQIAREWANGNPLTFVIYGGGMKVKQFAKEHGCIYITPVVTLKKGQKAIEKIQDSIAFFGQEFSVVAALPQANIFQKQIADFGKKIEDNKPVKVAASL